MEMFRLTAYITVISRFGHVMHSTAKKARRDDVMIIGLTYGSQVMHPETGYGLRL
jgi:hypothetical protein